MEVDGEGAVILCCDAEESGGPWALVGRLRASYTSFVSENTGEGIDKRT